MHSNEIISIMESHSEWLKSGGKDGVRGSLINMDLKQFDFSRLNLSEICLDGSNLDDCNFQWSIMDRAKLRNVKLKNADFRYAILTDADFHSSELSYCDFRSANLSGTSFNSAVLKGANLCESNIQNTIWSNVVLEDISISRSSFDLIPKTMLEVFSKFITVL
jgi:uncharacterized protein YjbI with pentapeptide repeats